jgi:hypothetical protein
MRLITKLRFLIASLMLGAVLLSASPVAAFNVFQPPSCNNGGDAHVCVCQPGTSSTSVCSDAQKTNGNPVLKTIKTVADIIAVIAGLAAVITLMVAGFSYITSGGNSEATNKARSRIIGALVGLVIIALAWTIVSFVVSKLLT